MNTGSILGGRPCLGSWALYGLGSVNQNLPGYVVLLDYPEDPPGGGRNWGTGFMATTYQGTRFRAGRTPVLHLQPDDGHLGTTQRARLDFIQELNRKHRASRMEDSDLEARIASYELAYRMQSAAPEAVDLAKETAATRKLYGIDDKTTERMGRNCLLARRLVERGVRFVQLYCGSGSKWDAHSNVETNHAKYCRESDKPIAGLLKDLASRGLLDSTLVVWGGEFGRTPMSESGVGRDHNPWGFTMWLAGGGIKGGMTHGATDELGLYAVEKKVHVHDLHATILHCLGLDHKKLTLLHSGREERPTINGGKVVMEVLKQG
jgi:arylsulfatase A-like enzyme